MDYRHLVDTNGAARVLDPNRPVTSGASLERCPREVTDPRIYIPAGCWLVSDQTVVSVPSSFFVATFE